MKISNRYIKIFFLGFATLFIIQYFSVNYKWAFSALISSRFAILPSKIIAEE